MSQKAKTYFNWSTGKDAALALYHLQKDGRFTVDKLLTTVNNFHNRVSMHGLRKDLLELQAKSIGIPLVTVKLPKEPSMEDYNHIMSATVEGLQEEGYTRCGFGDIFLEDLRTYREEQLKPYGIKAHFPLWKRNTKALVEEFIGLGFKAIVICTKATLLDESFVGRALDANFLRDLPSNVDPCGENGEFHTFCYDGPIFKEPIKFKLGEKVFRAYKTPKGADEQKKDSNMGFWFCDLVPIK